MLNQVVLVGRITKDIQVVTTPDERKVCNITIAVPRSFKNAEGEYETDFIPVALWGNIAENTAEYCRKGDLVGIKGRLSTTEKQLILTAERVTFLSSKKEEKED